MPKGADRSSIVLRWRLFLFLSVLALVLLGGMLLLFFVLDVSPGRKAKEDLRGHLERYEDHLFTYFGNTAARGIQLSGQVAKEVERTLAEHKAGFADVSDNPGLIAALERNTFDILRNSMLITDCSGAFIIFDATVNSSLPGSEHSRCGLYLKLANINASNPVNPEMLWTRGAHEVGLENKLIFHNQWELEFTTNRKPFYRMVLGKASATLRESYYYSPVIRLQGTWERVMLLFVPIVGKGGQVYGVCGFEISAIFFKLTHPASEGRGKRISGLIAQKSDNVIHVGTGLESGAASGYFAELGGGELRLKRKDGRLNIFTLEDGREFVGMYKKISLSPLSGDEGKTWVAACFMPKEEYDRAIRKNYLRIAVCCAVFLALAAALCWYINRKCVVPLLAGIDAIKSGAARKTNIQEIDDLLEFLAANDRAKDGAAGGGAAENSSSQGDSPENSLGQEGSVQSGSGGRDIDMSGFYEFEKNIATLSKAEKSVFDLYMAGRSASEIAELLYISINTVKSHNKNIYRKLNVSSRKALMIYIQMMKGAHE